VATADAGAGLVYTVSVASCSEGTIRPSLKASSVVDAASNSGPTAAADGSTTVTYDVVAGAPTATWSAESSGAQTSLAGLSWTLTFSEAVTGLIGGDIDNPDLYGQRCIMRRWHDSPSVECQLRR
jgi:hypothetical protein